MTRPNLAVHAANCNVTENSGAICSCGASEQVATEQTDVTSNIRRFTLHIDKAVYADIRRAASLQGRTMSKQIEHMVRAALMGAPDGKLREQR